MRFRLSFILPLLLVICWHLWDGLLPRCPETAMLPAFLCFDGKASPRADLPRYPTQPHFDFSAVGSGGVVNFLPAGAPAGRSPALEA